MPTIDTMMRSIDEYLDHIERWADEVIVGFRGVSAR
jgi:hypothetical protein